MLAVESCYFWGVRSVYLHHNSSMSFDDFGILAFLLAVTAPSSSSSPSVDYGMMMRGFQAKYFRIEKINKDSAKMDEEDEANI